MSPRIEHSDHVYAWRKGKEEARRHSRGRNIPSIRIYQVTPKGTSILREMYSSQGSDRYPQVVAYVSTNLQPLHVAIGIVEKSNNQLEIRELAREALRQFEGYARAFMSKRDVKVSSADIREWKSVENPAWGQFVVDFIVDTEPKTAMSLWDNLVDELNGFIESQFRENAEELHDLLSLTVRWE